MGNAHKTLSINDLSWTDYHLAQALPSFLAMSLTPLYGHEALRERLASAAGNGRLPQALLLTGPEGVGKQRLALWVAQLLLCPDGSGEPCGRCQECRFVLDLAHPDLHWFVPIPRPKAADASKQVEEVRLTLGDVMAERRESGRWEPADGTSGHWLASVRLLQRAATLTPFRGARKVLVLGDADRLIVQDANLEAANAVLKLLEEPPADTTIMLTTSAPGALLPTIRSRVVPVRVGRVPDAAVRAYAARELGAEHDPGLGRQVTVADGRIGLLVRPGGGDEAAARRAGTILEAAHAGPDRWAAVALAQPPWGARGEFATTLDALSLELRARMQRSAAAQDVGALGRLLEAADRVDAVRAAIGTNVNPQLALAGLGGALGRAR